MYVIACAEQNLFRTCRHVYSKVPTLSATLVCVYVMMTLCAIVASNGGCDGCDMVDGSPRSETPMGVFSSRLVVRLNGRFGAEYLNLVRVRVAGTACLPSNLGLVDPQNMISDEFHCTGPPRLIVKYSNLTLNRTSCSNRSL